MKTMFQPLAALRALLALTALSGGLAGQALAQPTPPNAPLPLRPGDHIAAVVNQELVTAYELNQRMAQARDDAGRRNQRLPPEAEFRSMILESLIEERAMLSHARDSGMRIDETEIDRAVQVVASQNQMTLAQLRARLVQDGMDLPRFRANIRDQLLIERVREREVAQRIRVTDGEIDAFIEQQRGAAAGEVQYNIAQILIKLPENPSEAAVAERRAQFVYGTAAEVMAAMYNLPPKVTILRPGTKVEGEPAADEMAEAIKAGKAGKPEAAG